MIDVWSKRGVVLLNISPKADGTIIKEQRSVLTAIGEWIDKHEEAVYNTRAHTIYGYGEAAFEEGHFGGQSATIDYNEKDIRFTVSVDQKHLYIYSLGLPAPDSPIEIRTNINPNIKRVSVLGSGVDVPWSVADSTLTFTTPNASDMDSIATVFDVQFE
jgi:alpha-L-fucosidase